MSNSPNIHSRHRGLLSSLTLLLAVSALLPAILVGQEEGIESPFRWREKGLRIGLFSGYHAGNRGPLDFGQGPAAVTGAKLRLRASSPLSLELGATYAAAERWVVDAAADGGPAIIDTVSAGWLRLDVGTQIALTGARTWHGLQPYGLAGAGFVFGINEGASEFLADPALAPFRYDISTAPHVFLGLGVEFFPSKKIGIGFEIRDYLIRLTTPNGLLLRSVLDLIEEAGAPAPQSVAWQHNPEFGISIWYYF